MHGSVHPRLHLALKDQTPAERLCEFRNPSARAENRLPSTHTQSPGAPYRQQGREAGGHGKCLLREMEKANCGECERHAIKALFEQDPSFAGYRRDVRQFDDTRVKCDMGSRCLIENFSCTVSATML